MEDWLKPHNKRINPLAAEEIKGLDQDRFSRSLLESHIPNILLLLASPIRQIIASKPELLVQKGFTELVKKKEGKNFVEAYESLKGSGLFL